MSGMRSLTSVDPSEYDRIEGAMSESERGRWFLAEYARRNRTADTDVLLGAIARLESAVTGDRETDRSGRMRGDLMDMANAIARTKAEIAAISTPDQDQSRLGFASVALDAIIRATERATSDILGAAEDVQEAAWTLRESGSDPAVCDELDRRATEIYTACSFQDLTAQRTARIIHTLRYLEERLGAMIAIWGGEIDAVPTAPGAEGRAAAQDLDQSDVDRFIDMQGIGTAEPPRPADLATLHDDVLFLETADMPVPAAPETDAVLQDPTQDEPAPEESAAETPAMEEAAAREAAIQGDVPEPASEEDAIRPDTSVQALSKQELMQDAPERVAKTEGNKTEIAKTDIAKTDIATAFADIDGLTDEEKLALFS